MQKVVGSSPIIRFNKAPLDGAFCCLQSQRTNRKGLATAHPCPIKGPFEGLTDRREHFLRV